MAINWWKPGDDFPGVDRQPTLEFRCHHCHKGTVVHQRSVADAEAKHWRERYERLMASLNDALERCTREHGHDAVRAFMLADLIALRERFGLDGDEWKRGKPL